MPSFDHAREARAVIPDLILGAATLLDLRAIVDHSTMENDPDAPRMYAFVRRPRALGPPDAPKCIAYVHVQIKADWVPDEAAWLELFTQLWPGY